jgi:drug/metabolite transporter (DMT)-like permease
LAALLALAAGACFSAQVVMVRLAQRRPDASTDVGAVVTIGTSIVAVSVLAVASGQAFGDLDVDNLWRWAVVGAIAPGAVQIVFMTAIEALGPSRTMVVVGASPMLAGVLAVFFLDERWTAPLVIGSVLVVAGGATLAWDRRGGAPPRWALGLGCAIVTAVGFATRDVVTRKVAGDTATPVTIAAATILATGWVVTAAGTVVTRRGRAWGLRDAIVGFGPSGLAVGIALPTLLAAFRRGEVTVVSPVSNAAQAVLVLVLSGIFVARTELDRRIVAALAIIVAGGTVIVAFG